MPKASTHELKGVAVGISKQQLMDHFSGHLICHVKSHERFEQPTRIASRLSPRSRHR